MIYIIGNDGTPQRVDGVGNELYPVGSIYMSTTNAKSPAEMFGGTWEQIKDKFLLSAGDAYSAGSTGGETMHTHGLDTPTARAILFCDANGLYYNEFRTDTATGVRNTTNYKLSGTGSSATADSAFATKLGGYVSSVSNMPPYLVVYCWKRIS